MQVDFARVTFDAVKHYSRVLGQQGRVQLESDANEQVAILLHLLRTAARDVLGPFAGPRAACGFGIYTPTPDPTNTEEEKEAVKAVLNGSQRDLVIGPGRYYVDGILCENEKFVLYSRQPDSSAEPLDPGRDLPCLVYLDVFERAVAAFQDATMREVALDGPDTAARAKVAWAVRIQKLSQVPANGAMKDMKPTWEELVEEWQPRQRALLRVQAGQRDRDEEALPCVMPPHARYRGHENQLYRVELHGVDPKSGRPTFKYSRDNATVVFPVESMSESTVTLQHLGRDQRFGLANNQFVEILDDGVIDTPQPLYKVLDVDIRSRRVTLQNAGQTAPSPDVGKDPARHPFLRRWDQRTRERSTDRVELIEGAVLIPNEKDWIPLEDGISVQFQGAGDQPPKYRPGDYWLVAARVATGDVEWPQDADGPRAVPPHGVTHHYAPLAALKKTKIEVLFDCRPKFESLETGF